MVRSVEKGVKPRRGTGKSSGIRNLRAIPLVPGDLVKTIVLVSDPVPQ